MVDGTIQRALPVALALMLLGGCERQVGTIDAWVADDMVNLTDRMPPTADPEVFDPETNTIRTFAAVNETVSFQIVIDPGDEPMRGVKIEFGDLLRHGPPAGTFRGKPAPEDVIGAENIRPFRMLPVSISAYPAWYLRLLDGAPAEGSFYDPLVPLEDEGEGLRFDVASGERCALWVDLYVPRDALPGKYVAPVTIASRGRRSWTARIELEVYDFVLPDARPIAAVGGFDHRAIFRAFIRQNGRPYVPAHLDRRRPLVREGLVVIRQLMRLAHAHRLDLFDREIHPVLKRDMFGKIRLDWENYDAIVTPYLTGSAFKDRIGCPAWPSPFREDWPDPDTYGGVRSDAYAAVAGSVLAASREHFDKLPGVDEQIFHWPFRGKVGAEGYERHARLGRIIRSADPQTPILSQLPLHPPKPTNWRAPEDFARLADIFAPRAEWFDPALPARLAGPEHPLVGGWLSPGTPPYLPSLGVIASASDVRAVPWFAMKYKCTGLFLDEVLNWTGDLTAAEADSATRLFYPGTIAGIKRVLPSVRLKRLRRGLQDIAYVWLLVQRQRMGIAMAVTNALVRYAGTDAAGDHYLDPRLDGWVRDGSMWRAARRLMAEEVQALVHPTTPTNKRFLADQLAWRRFDERVHTIRVEEVRSRVTPVASPSTAPHSAPTRLRANVLLDLYNEYSRAADVLVKIDSLPPGWKAIRTERRLSPLPPATRAVVALTAEGTYVPAAADGKMLFPLSITTDLGQHRKISAYVAFLRAGRVSTPPKIDGRLDDWPMRPGNTAGSFKLIGRRARVGDGLAKRQTLAFVLADERNIYIAFRCEEPDMSALAARSDNMVRYEQLMASGEDLVEVILDPGMSATAAEDLYHIVVKANGILLSERGVRSDPPLGRVRDWSAGASVAVAAQDKLWVVELAIPRSAFGAAGGEQFWGINFTRFATQGLEGSSWSGAARYFYDPRNLGTMYVPPEGASPAK